MRTATLPIAVDRWQPATLTVRVVGLDMRGSVNRLQARLIADTPGLPLIDLTDVTNGAAEGIRLVSVAIEDGRPVSTFKLRINETTVEGLPFAGERGDDTIIGYDWQTSVGGNRRLLARGPLTVVAGFTGADNAPPGMPSGYGGYPAQRGSAPWSTAQLTFSDDDVTISIDGTDLLGVAQDQALAAIGRARDQAVETVQNSTSAAAGYAAEAATSADRAASHAGIDVTFATKAAAAAAQIAVGKVVQVLVDETMSGSRTIYQKRADGSLAFIATLIGAGDLASTAAQRGAALVGFDAGRTVRDVLLAAPLERLMGAAMAVLDRNEFAADSFTPYKRIGPGADYSPTGQWVWDSGFSALLAVVLGQAARAKAWLLNWPAKQKGDGMYPCTIGPGYNDNYSQMPVLAWAAWEVFAATNDLNFLATMYPSLKLNFAWWQAARMDGSGLFMFGSSRTGSPDAGTIAQDLRYESGEDANQGFFDEQYGGVEGMAADHVSPALSALMSLNADYLARMANALGNGEQAGWETQRDAIADRVRRFLWDEEMGRFAFLLRSDLAKGAGKLAVAAAAGATSITLADGAGIGFAVARGAKIVVGDGVAQVAADLVGTEMVIPLIAGLSAAAPKDQPVFVRPILYAATLSNHAFPLMAKVATQAQARRIVDEHLLYAFDGTVADTFTAFLGRDYTKASTTKGYLLKYKHAAWHAPLPGSATTIGAKAWTHAPGGDGIVATLFARGLAGDAQRPLAAIRPEWETPQRYRPLSASIRLTKAAAAGAVQLLLGDYPANVFVANVELPQPAGADGARVTVALDPLSTSARPFYARVLQQASGTAPMTVHAITLTSYPRGFVFATGKGLIANPRLSDYARATETNSDPADGGSAPLASDYWKGDHWTNLELVAVLGMLAYGMTAEAQQIGRQVIERVYLDYVRTGTLYERFSMRGQGKGSPDYVWTGNVLNIARALGLF
ncbi:hypothetical protein [uncultured Sphingomonas sp.]|uniref:MGH1-like glycoside hydrolase domain-containing protein n=1 Tax=uncultured Sphingomonas sp. TaxID=158754 RepID=UPI0025F1266F|nr:hypothetical protein [uncultured Sphingomonas sp.]